MGAICMRPFFPPEATGWQWLSHLPLVHTGNRGLSSWFCHAGERGAKRKRGNVTPGMQGASPSAGDPLWDSSSRTRNLHAAPARIFGGPSVLHSDCDLQNAGFHRGSVKRQPSTKWLLGPRSRELDTGGPTTAPHFASGGVPL